MELSMTNVKNNLFQISVDVKRQRFVVPYFGALRATLFTYLIISFTFGSSCTNSIFRSGSRRSTENAIDCPALANMFSVKDTSTLKNTARFTKIVSQKKAPEVFRVLFSQYLYVSPYWA